MKGSPAVPGGPLTSKPTWFDTLGCSTVSAFFVSGGVGTPLRPGTKENQRWERIDDHAPVKDGVAMCGRVRVDCGASIYRMMAKAQDGLGRFGCKKQL